MLDTWIESENVSTKLVKFATTHVQCVCMSVCNGLYNYCYIVAHFGLTFAHSPLVFCCFLQLLHKRLGIQVLGLLIEVEGQGFEKRVSTYLPILTDCLSLYGPHSTGEGLTETASTKPVAIREDREDSAASDNEPVLETVTNENTLFNKDSVSDGEGEMDVEEDGEKLQGGESTSKELTGMAAMAALDHLLFTTLSTIHKLVCQCSVLRGSNFASHMTVMWGAYKLYDTM